jgi:hypothetical protein
VTLPQEASLMEQLPPGLQVELLPELLKGIAETNGSPSDTDEGVSFRARNDIPNLGIRDRVSLNKQIGWSSGP